MLQTGSESLLETIRAADSDLQADKPFPEYLSSFQAQIGDTGFDEVNQRCHFKNGLSRELTQYLIPMDTEAMTMNELIKTCHRLDNAHRQLASRNSTTNSRSTSAATTTTTASPAVHTSRNDNNTAIGLSKVQSRPRGPLTAQEKQRRRDQDLCLYSADPGVSSKNLLRKLFDRNTQEIKTPKTAKVIKAKPTGKKAGKKANSTRSTSKPASKTKPKARLSSNNKTPTTDAELLARQLS